MHMMAQHLMVASNGVEDPRIVMTLTPTSQRYVHQTASMAIADMGRPYVLFWTMVLNRSIGDPMSLTLLDPQVADAEEKIIPPTYRKLDVRRGR